MRTAQIQDLAYFVQVYEDLKKISKSLHTLDENHCNYGLTSRQETRITSLEKKAEDLAQRIGLHAYHQSDPRGCSLYLIDDTMNDSTYNYGIAITSR